MNASDHLRQNNERVCYLVLEIYEDTRVSKWVRAAVHHDDRSEVLVGLSCNVFLFKLRFTRTPEGVQTDRKSRMRRGQKITAVRATTITGGSVTKINIKIGRK